MSTIQTRAEQHPDKPAIVFGNGETTISYGELEQRSRRLAHLFRAEGLEYGDGVALLMANEDPFYDVYWAAMRSGLYFTPLNWHLQLDEVRYIVDNCDAKVLLVSDRFAKIATAIASEIPKVQTRICYGDGIDGFRRFDELIADIPEDAPLDDQMEGAAMLYSSGTTGYPKGVRTRLSGRPAGDPVAMIAVAGLMGMFGFNEDDRYLSPAPLYHAAPLAFSTAQQRIGSTAVVMRSFDAEDALRTIQDQKITTSQWVPTHFRRLLQLPDDVRSRYDLSSLRVAVHAAAPCPVPVKEAMIQWWGPVVVEYYAGTEGGGTMIHSEEWMQHKGSVGRHWAGGTLHILDEDGGEVTEPGVEGAIYFEGPEDPEARFKYYKDDEKTASSYRGRLFTLGDIGYLDADGFLYLTDRKSHMIISGGVNIYPQEVENHLSTHPNVDDVAVIGVPNEEMGEEVKAVVIPRQAEPDEALAEKLIEFCREHIAHYKCPRSIDFVEELPRLPNGKLLKRSLRERYWQDQGSRI
jgi:acyl-CoA synthetase (AMP-forming)/AMP-acid ligase II